MPMKKTMKKKTVTVSEDYTEQDDRMKVSLREEEDFGRMPKGLKMDRLLSSLDPI